MQLFTLPTYCTFYTHKTINKAKLHDFDFKSYMQVVFLCLFDKYLISDRCKKHVLILETINVKKC